MGKFKKGMFLGGLLGAGMMWLSATKKGREMRDKMLDYAADVYGEVKEKAMDPKVWENMTKNKYVKMVGDKVDEYAAKHEWSNNTKNMVKKMVAAQWCNLKKDKQKK